MLQFRTWKYLKLELLTGNLPVLVKLVFVIIQNIFLHDLRLGLFRELYIANQ
jgi:hypothetical protein